jgi:hypothetical protein
MNLPVVLGHRAGRVAFTAWDAPVEIELAGPVNLLSGAQTLVERLESLWDPTGRDSDVARMLTMIGTMVTVEPETVALVELAARAAWRRPDPPFALHDVVIDRHRGRVGLPAADLLDLASMVPTLTAALLIRYLTENGASAVRVRVGQIVRTTSDVGPAVAA